MNKNKIIGITVIVILLGTVASFYMKAQKIKPKEVSVRIAAKETLKETALLTGNIEAKNRNSIILNPSEKVIKILVAEGQRVKKEEILMQLETWDYENQLKKAKLNLENAETGLRVVLGTGSIADKSVSENSLLQAKLTVENAQRSYEDANKKYEQNKILFQSGSLSKNEVENSKKVLEDSITFLEGAKESVINAENIVNNTSSSSDSKIINQKNQVALIAAEIENLNKKIEDRNIRSSIEGQVIKIDGREKEFPKEGEQIIIEDDSEYKVSVDLNQQEALKAALGQKARIRLKGSKASYEGSISKIDKFAEIKSTAGGKGQEAKLLVEVNIDQPGKEIKAGYEAEVEFIFNEKSSALAVAFQGIKEEKSTGKKYLFIVDKENKLSKRYIQTGLETDSYLEVIEGMKEGEKYVINPVENLKEGDLVAETNGAKQ